MGRAFEFRDATPLPFGFLYDTLIHTKLYLALIAVAETVVTIVLLEFSMSLAPVVVGLLTFSVYANDQLIDLEDDEMATERAKAFVSRYRDLIYVFASVAYGMESSLSVWGVRFRSPSDCCPASRGSRMRRTWCRVPRHKQVWASVS